MTVKNALCKKDFSKKIFFWKFFKLFFKKLLTNQFFFDIICWSSRNDQILGCRQAVRHQTLTLTFPGFESLHPSQEKSRLRKQSAFFSYIRLRRVVCTSCVILPSAVICATRVRSYKANIISLRNEVEQYHYELCE